jgi:hypothetical protein
MPENLIHCQSCRALLNEDLKRDSVEIPEFVPLHEIESMIDVPPAGYYLNCPVCERELRVRPKYVGTRVQCKFCNGQFPLNLDSQVRPHAFFADCPECKNELRANVKYMGQKVACKHCGGKIHFVEAAG